MQHRVVSQEEWLKARKAHLKNEKALTRLRDLVNAERRALPWVRVEKNYVFETPAGRQSLADLFGHNSQLLVYHFMWLWESGQGCTGCSFLADHIDGADLHLKHHDVSVVVVSRAPLAEFAAYRRRMGWRFAYASSYGNDFNFDYHVSFAKDELARGKVEYNYGMTEGFDELPGVSVFVKNDAGEVFHTYSCYARGLDVLLGAHGFLDLMPKGRNENGVMDWVRRHDEYADNAAACRHNAA